MSGDHNQYQKSAPYDMKECGTCGYPLLPEERTGLVEVNGKMVNPPDVVEPDMGIDRGAWSDVPDATKWVDELRGDEEPPNSTTDVVEPDMRINCDAWSEVLNATKWVIPKGQAAEGLSKREWVSLTDEQIAQAVGSPLDEVYLADFRKVEAKLKEMNNE